MRTAAACLILASLAGSGGPAWAQSPPQPGVQPVAAEPTADRRLTQLELRAFHVLGSGLSFRRVSAADVLGRRPGEAADRPNRVRDETAHREDSAAIRPVAGDDVEPPASRLVQRAADEPGPPLPREASDDVASDCNTADGGLPGQGPVGSGSHVRLESSDLNAEPAGLGALPATDSAGNPLRRAWDGSAGATDELNPLRRWFRLHGE